MEQGFELDVWNLAKSLRMYFHWWTITKATCNQLEDPKNNGGALRPWAQNMLTADR